MQSLFAQYDPVNADLCRYLAETNAADAHADAVNDRADAIATTPNAAQFADAFCAMGTGQGDMQKLRDAWLKGRDTFMAEVVEQLNAGFAAVADLEIEQETEALACDAYEVMRDWD
jgi:hypothetical protein